MAGSLAQLGQGGDYVSEPPSAATADSAYHVHESDTSGEDGTSGGPAHPQSFEAHQSKIESGDGSGDDDVHTQERSSLSVEEGVDSSTSTGEARGCLGELQALVVKKYTELYRASLEQPCLDGFLDTLVNTAGGLYCCRVRSSCLAGVPGFASDFHYLGELGKVLESIGPGITAFREKWLKLTNLRLHLKDGTKAKDDFAFHMALSRFH
jgi:hypothetical protein